MRKMVTLTVTMEENTLREIKNFTDHLNKECNNDPPLEPAEVAVDIIKSGLRANWK